MEPPPTSIKSDLTLASLAMRRRTPWPSRRPPTPPQSTFMTPQEKHPTHTTAGPPSNPLPSLMVLSPPGGLPPTFAGTSRTTFPSPYMSPQNTLQESMPLCGSKLFPKSSHRLATTSGPPPQSPGPSKCRCTGPDGANSGTRSWPTDGRCHMQLTPTHPPMTTAPYAEGHKTGLAISWQAARPLRPTTYPGMTLLSRQSGRASAEEHLEDTPL